MSQTNAANDELLEELLSGLCQMQRYKGRTYGEDWITWTERFAIPKPHASNMT